MIDSDSKAWKERKAMLIEQAKKLRPREILHYTGQSDCERRVGPRGGVTTKIVEVRVNGVPQIWKRDPNRVRVPIQHGLYNHGYIDETNLEQFHLASECPVIHPDRVDTPTGTTIIGYVAPEQDDDTHDSILERETS